MKKNIVRLLAIVILVLPIYLTFFANQNRIRSVPVINIKDQLSSAQLSYFGRLSSYSGSIIKVDLGTSAPSNTTANVMTGDTLAIANAGVTTVSYYIVRDVGDTATIELASSVGTTTPMAFIVATHSAIHTVSFTPQSATSGEIWQFLFKISSRNGEVWSDGMPDQTGFDLGSTIPGVGTTGLGTRIQASDITCPFSGTASVGTSTWISSGINTGSTGTYGIVQCSLAVGTSNSGIATSMVVGKALNLGSQLINPSPGISHTPGQADVTSDTHAFAVRQLDNSSNILDITFGKIAVTESVRITAIVDPTITFIISNVGVTNIGTTLCGSPLGNGVPNTTATSVSFGPLVLGTYNNAAQRISCTTNSTNGYVIQAYKNRPLTMLGTTTTLPDGNCGGSGCSVGTTSVWTSYTASGFGYAMQVGTTTGVAANVTLGIGTTNRYKLLGNGNGNAQTILSRTDTPGGTDFVYICYRITASTTQPAGTYEDSISYIATATF